MVSSGSNLFVFGTWEETTLRIASHSIRISPCDVEKIIVHIAAGWIAALFGVSIEGSVRDSLDLGLGSDRFASGFAGTYRPRLARRTSHQYCVVEAV